MTTAKSFTVLFDLDGTLLDTAPDMIACLNLLRAEYQLVALPDERLRNTVSNGSIAMLKAGFDLSDGDESLIPLQERFLTLYQQNLSHLTRFFPGMNTVIDTLDRRGIRWGIVTNKPERLTQPLLAALQLTERSACIISGDTLPQKKPAPEPLLYGCQIAGGDPEHCLYVGDAQRDIESGRRAGMKTIAACYGYLNDNDQPETWQADHLVDHPLEILDRLEQYL